MNQWIHVKPFMENVRGRETERPFLASKSSTNNEAVFIEPMDYMKKDPDEPTQRKAYNRRAKLKLRYINHPGKIALLGLTTRPTNTEISHSTDVSKTEPIFFYCG